MEAMNRHFAFVGPKLGEKITSKVDDDYFCYTTPQTNAMAFKTINETYMHNAIRKLKNGKAAGPDKIPTTINEDVGDLITKPLTMTFRPRLHGNGSTWNRTRTVRIGLAFTRELVQPFHTESLTVQEPVHLASRFRTEPNQNVLV